MRALFVSSEIFPLAKTGGLADVSAALPSELARQGIDFRLAMPGYRHALDRLAGARQVAHYDNILGFSDIRIIAGRLPNSSLQVFLVDCPDLYNRDGGLYQNEQGEDWPDNALRFALFNHVAKKMTKGVGEDSWRPDLVHANDWHAGLLPLLIGLEPHPRPATLLTIHNLAYQGVFGMDQLPNLGVPATTLPALEFYGNLSFLKAGICSADALTTVSPTYAKEILTPEQGCGLDSLLLARADRLTGILNGMDTSLWDPGTDGMIPCMYTPRQISGKRACKAALQKELGLDMASDVPIVAFMSRLAHQKMPDVVLEALPSLLEANAQFVVLANGDGGYEDQFRQYAAQFPGQVVARIGYEEGLAHRILAGADILLHPSRYEPCGLTPMYAMRYGTVPIVRKSGGLADSVIDDGSQAATGFAFDGTSAAELIACSKRAIDMYRQPIAWRRIQVEGMGQDFGWPKSAEAYAALYRDLIGEVQMPWPEEKAPSERLLA